MICQRSKMQRHNKPSVGEFTTANARSNTSKNILLVPYQWVEVVTRHSGDDIDGPEHTDQIHSIQWAHIYYIFSTTLLGSLLTTSQQNGRMTAPHCKNIHNGAVEISQQGSLSYAHATVHPYYNQWGLRFSPAKLTFGTTLRLLVDFVCPNRHSVPTPSEAFALKLKTTMSGVAASSTRERVEISVGEEICFCLSWCREETPKWIIRRILQSHSPKEQELLTDVNNKEDWNYIFSLKSATILPGEMLGQEWVKNGPPSPESVPNPHHRILIHQPRQPSV